MKKIYEEIDERREIEIKRFMFGIGIRNVGEVNEKRIEREYI